MKYVFFLLSAGFWMLQANGQTRKESEIPLPVKNAFEKKYPHTKASWDKEGVNYEANFRQDGKAMSAVIDKNGTIVETETTIPVTDLPTTVKAYIEKHYAGVKIEEAARIVKANGDINYEAEVRHKDLVFDANGKFIKETRD